MKSKLRNKWRNKVKYITAYLPWLALIVFMQISTGLLLWLADLQIFNALFLLLILFSLIVFVGICFVLIRLEIKREEAIKEILSNPEVINEKNIIKLFGSAKKDSVRQLASVLSACRQEAVDTNTIRLAYEDYVETWIHEIKLPLALLTLILDNKSDELPEDLAFKLDYIRSQIQNNVSQILFYYRIGSGKNDYLLVELDCKQIIDEVLLEFEPLLHEKNFRIEFAGENAKIYTDQRSFCFIIEQIIANSIKYCQENPYLKISIGSDGKVASIEFEDNGCGIKDCDLPHIFEKGFTGDTGKTRQKSTGMGLYLTKRLADNLKIELKVSAKWQEGTSITLKVAGIS